MYSDILRRIAGIEVFPVISLLLFVTVFSVALIWTLRLDAERIGRLSRLPLDTSGDDVADGAATPTAASLDPARSRS
jgi:hypothetical protein